MTQERLVFDCTFSDAGNRLTGNNQNMHGGLRSNIVKSDAELVLMNQFSGDFPIGYFLKDCFRSCHRKSQNHDCDSLVIRQFGGEGVNRFDGFIVGRATF